MTQPNGPPAPCSTPWMARSTACAKKERSCSLPMVTVLDFKARDINGRLAGPPSCDTDAESHPPGDNRRCIVTFKGLSPFPLLTFFPQKVDHMASGNRELYRDGSLSIGYICLLQHLHVIFGDSPDPYFASKYPDTNARDRCAEPVVGSTNHCDGGAGCSVRGLYGDVSRCLVIN